MSALDILRETTRILRHHPSPFLSSLFLLLSPISSSLLFLPPKTFQIPLPLFSKFLSLSHLPLSPTLLSLSLHLSSSLLSSLLSQPLLLPAHSLVSLSVAASYASVTTSLSLFLSSFRKFWPRIILTCLSTTFSLLLLFSLSLSLLLATCSVFSLLGYPQDLLLYPAFLVLLAFSIAYAHLIVVCNLATVISVLEDVSGFGAMWRAAGLVRGQTRAGLVMFLGSTVGLAFVEGLFDHRVRSLSYGDGSSRIWEGPLLVVMYSFVLLVDSMMSAVFYFTCRSTCLEELGVEEESESLVDSEKGLVEMQSIR